MMRMLVTVTPSEHPSLNQHLQRTFDRELRGPMAGAVDAGQEALSWKIKLNKVFKSAAKKGWKVINNI